MTGSEGGREYVPVQWLQRVSFTLRRIRHETVWSQRALEPLRPSVHSRLFIYFNWSIVEQYEKAKRYDTERLAS